LRSQIKNETWLMSLPGTFETCRWTLKMRPVRIWLPTPPSFPST